MTPQILDQIARDMVAAFGTSQLLERVTTIHPDFSADDGYSVAHRIRELRQARGERAVGRKIGGTNPAVYPLTGATGPVWNFIYDSTVADLPAEGGRFEIGQFRQSRIEPELVLHLAEAPRAGMDEMALLGCIDKIAHGFEFVFSPYSDRQVKAPDTHAAYGLHQALRVGPWVDITGDRAGWAKRLRTFEVVLSGSNGQERRGGGANVLGSPVLALKFIVDDIATHPDWLPVAAGEIITTGTLTELMPISPGETWSTKISGAPIEGLRVEVG